MNAEYWKASKVIMDFLESQNATKRTLGMHDRSIRQLAKYLDENDLQCTHQAVDTWLKEGKNTWSNCKFKECRTCAKRLLEALNTGRVSKSPQSHYGSPDYDELTGWTKDVVDKYVAQLSKHYRNKTHLQLAKSSAAYFLVASGASRLESPSQITSELILNFVSTCEGIKRTRAYRLAYARGLLLHMHESNQIDAWAPMLASDYFAKYKDCYVAPPEWAYSKSCISAQEMISRVEVMVQQEMPASNFSKTVIKTTKKALRMLYITLAVNNEGYTYEKAKIWLNAISDKLGAQVRPYKHAVFLFDTYLVTGRFEPDATMLTLAKLDKQYPSWTKTAIDKYFYLKRREGYAKSTLTCIKNALYRFTWYLNNKGINSWESVDGSVVTSWCLEDEHSTAEGRSCYVAKVRCFLEYLEEENLVNTHLSFAAKSKVAPTRRIVEVLDLQAIQKLEHKRQIAQTPMELRSAAMVALGITMGLRASDITQLKISDISWSDSSITFI